jgi:hypothetical protein
MSTAGPDFPDLVPTARSLSPGDFAGKTFRSQSGVESRVQYGNKAFDKTLDLEYNNIADTSAALIYDHYLNCKGTLYYFLLLEKPKAGALGFHSPSGKFVNGQAYTDLPLTRFGRTYYFGFDPNKSPTEWFTSASPVNGVVPHSTDPGFTGEFIEAAPTPPVPQSQGGLQGYYPDPNANYLSARYSATPFGLKYRYAEPPQFNSVKPGRMSVTVKLIGVLDS